MCGMLQADAAYRFYRTKCEEDSIKCRGKAVFLAKQKRKHERLTRVMTMHYCSLQNFLFCCPCIHYYILDVTHVYDFYYYLIIIFLCSNEVLQLYFNVLLALYLLYVKSVVVIIVILFSIIHVHALNNIQKLAERKGALGRMEFRSADSMSMWEKVMTTAMMSSEESGNDGDDEILSLHPLLFRSAKVDHFFSLLDGKVKEEKSPQARRQMKRRVRGDVSTRPLPVGHNFPKWALN